MSDTPGIGPTGPTERTAPDATQPVQHIPAVTRSVCSGNWRGVGAAVRGVSHQRSGQPCQDAFEIRSGGGDTLLIAVADGAGSAALAEIGSGCAARAAVEGLARLLPAPALHGSLDWRHLLRETLAATRTALEAEASSRNRPLSDLATTLLVAAVTPALVAVVQVGDGAVVVRTTTGQPEKGEKPAEESFTAVTTPTRGEYLNETVFVTSPGWQENAQYVVYPGPITGAACFSDGLQMLALKMPQGTAHGPFFKPLLKFVAEVADVAAAEAQLRGFLESPRLAQRADDDLSLVLTALRA